MALVIKKIFNRLSDAQIQSDASKILSAMSGNIHFPNPAPSVAEMELLITDFKAALANCQTGDRIKIAVKNELRKLLAQNLHKWSIYVLYQSDNDRSIAITSGFTIAPPKSRRPPLTKPSPPVITNGLNRGELIVRGKRVINALSYDYQYTTSEELQPDDWTSIISSTTKVVIKNLRPGQLYRIRIAVIGSRKELVYSEPIDHIIGG